MKEVKKKKNSKVFQSSMQGYFVKKNMTPSQKLRVGAKDFATRFERVMKDLSNG